MPDASRIVRIPAAYLPGSGADPSRADITLTLVDRTGKPVPASSQPNAALFVGTKRLTVTTLPVALTVATQDQINGETFYQVSVTNGTDTWTKRVQVPAADGSDLTWAEFIGLTAPVSPASGRLLPDPAEIPDGYSLTVASGLPRWTEGPQGEPGPQGDPGPQGPAGPAGADGAQGPQGPAGPAGADGAQGQAGPQGIQGPAGADGADGAQGPQGDPGPTAVSADAGNLASLGTDGLLHVPLIDLASDVTGDLPLADLTGASAASTLLGRGSASGAGDWQQIGLGSGLVMSGTTLQANPTPTDTQTFSTPGTATWTKPSGGQNWCTVFVVPGGGGGGSGAVRAPGTLATGGRGGSAGPAILWTGPITRLDATETITVGAGGAGGAGQTSDNSNGNPSASGGPSSIGTKFISQGGRFGGGGGNSVPAAAPLAVGYPASASTAIGVLSSASQNDTIPSPFGAGSGGPGGTMTSGNVVGTAGDGAAGSPGYVQSLIAGGTDGTGAAAGGAGANGSAAANEPYAMGAGGGGSQAADSADSAAGGAGGYPGGGGGGSGGVRNGYDSGPGGAGAHGYVRVECY